MPELLFPNARYYVGESAWARALAPHRRDRASFVPALNLLLKESGRLNTLRQGDILDFGSLKVDFFHSDGHTPGMLCSDLRWEDQRLVFAADLIPGGPWVHLPITMGYDRFSEQLIDEKERLLHSVVRENAWVFFTHDTRMALSGISYDGTRSRFAPFNIVKAFSRLSDLSDA